MKTPSKIGVRIERLLTRRRAVPAGALLLLLVRCSMLAQVVGSKHDFSVTGGGTIKSTTEQEVCRFCHIPHHASPTVPLWDHTLSSVSYSQYNSSTLAGTYTAQFPNSSSKLCLSCHDGTIAIGSTIRGTMNVSGGRLLDPDQSLAANAASNLGGASGAVLTDDHPISFTFNHAVDNHYTVAGRKDNLSCVGCHDPHKEGNDPVTGKFLSQSNSGSALCLTCHNPPYWSSNPTAHQSSTKSMPGGWSHTGYGTVASNGCESCHKPHSAGVSARLFKASEETACDPCHSGIANGGITEKNVSNTSGGQYQKLYVHPTYSITGKHNPVNASPVTNSLTESSADMSDPNRHAECADCHAAHGAKTGLHTIKTNVVSNVIAGTWGIEPAAVTNWTQPVTFSRVDPATSEYQICLKCHSSYGLGSAPTGITTIIGPSGTNATDQAMEFNVNNFSAHPVKVGANSQTGSYAPKALNALQLTADWNSPGTQTMYCSDCHGNDQTVSSTVPAGPHGSNSKFMLNGTNQYWPTKPDGVTLWALDDFTATGPPVGLFCANCHPMKTGATWFDNVHQRHSPSSIGGNGYGGGSRLPCVSCHGVIPHGAKRSRLIAYDTDPIPYRYNGTGRNTSIVRGFKKTSRTGYQDANCYSVVSGCSSNHANQGGYDQ